MKASWRALALIPVATGCAALFQPAGNSHNPPPRNTATQGPSEAGTPVSGKGLFPALFKDLVGGDLAVTRKGGLSEVAAANARVEARGIDGSILGTAVADGNGAFSLTISSPLTNSRPYLLGFRIAETTPSPLATPVKTLVKLKISWTSSMLNATALASFEQSIKTDIATALGISTTRYVTVSPVSPISASFRIQSQDVGSVDTASTLVAGFIEASGGLTADNADLLEKAEDLYRKFDASLTDEDAAGALLNSASASAFVEEVAAADPEINSLLTSIKTDIAAAKGESPPPTPAPTFTPTPAPTPTPSPTPTPQAAGAMFTLAGGGTGFTGGAAATAVAMSAYGFDRNAAGDLYIADLSAVRLVPASSGTRYGQAVEAGKIYTILGGGQSAPTGTPESVSALELKGGTIVGVSVDAAGNVFAADRARGCVYLLPAAAGTVMGLPVEAGQAYVVAGKYGGTGAKATQTDVTATEDTLYTPMDAVVDPSGNLLIGQEDAGSFRLLPDESGTAYGLAVTFGRIYTLGPFAGGFQVEDVFVGPGGETLLGGSEGSKGTVWKLEADGSRTVLYHTASTRFITGMVRDAAGNLLYSAYRTKAIEILPEADGSAYGVSFTKGATASIATGLDGPKQLALDAAGDLYFNDGARIRKIKR